MPRELRQFRMTLNETEAQELLDPKGVGGHQQLHDVLRSQLADGRREIILGDEDLGKVIRYMTSYGSGGFQGRLRRALHRPISEVLGRRTT